MSAASILVDDWRQAWRKLSVWAFALVGISPDLYSAIVAMGWLADENVPPAFVWSLRILAVAGVAMRLIRQTKAKPA